MMNRDRIEGNWKQFKGSVRQHWCKLTGDHPGIAAGKRTRLAGSIQTSYGISRDEMKKQLCAWQKQQDNSAAPIPQSTHRTQT
jgi:uncharacterized protein YjbJ (UPF0337 family)